MPSRRRGASISVRRSREDAMTQLQVHVDRVLTEVDRQAELFLALLRTVILLVLAVLFSSAGAGGQASVMSFPVLGLALVTIGRLALVVAGRFRPWMAWIATTLDVLFLNHCL